MLTKLKRTEYTQCQQCGLLYTHGDPENFTEYYDWGKDKTKHYQTDYLTNPRTDAIGAALAGRMARLAQYSYVDKDVLEIGSSGGSFLRAVKKAGAKYILGIEISKDATFYAQQHGVPTICANFETWVPDGALWDCIVTIHTIEHFVDPVNAFTKIHGLLKPGGVWITQHPDADVYPGVLFHVRDQVPREHLNIFDKRTILKAIKGFDRFLYYQEDPGQSISAFHKEE